MDNGLDSAICGHVEMLGLATEAGKSLILMIT